MPLFAHDTLPASSQEAIQIFVERYLALSLVKDPDTWCEELGVIETTPSTSVHYPMAMLAMKYQETKDEGGRFRTIGERDVELKPVQHDDGVEIDVLKLVTNIFSARKWYQAPERMIQAEKMFRCQKIADMLEANSDLCGWDKLTLFNDAHIANPGAPTSLTFDNLQASAKDVTNMTHLEEEITLMMEVRDENGDKLGVMPDVIGVPTAKFQPLMNKMKQDLIANSAGTATVRNPYADGTLKVVHMSQLSDPNDWYLFDSKLIAKGAHPWAGAKLEIASAQFNALGMRIYEESSDRFKNTGKIAISSRIWYGFRSLYPHGVRKIVGA
jgi:hypothetical protein